MLTQSCGIHMLLKKLMSDLRRKDMKRMVKSRELRLNCKECEKNVTWNENRMCKECDIVHSRGDALINNENEEEKDRSKM